MAHVSLTTSDKTQLPKKLSVFIAFFLLVWASSAEAIDGGYSGALEIGLYGVLSIFILVSYFQLDPKYKRAKHLTSLAIVVAVLFSIGLMFQNLSASKTVLLLFTMYFIVLASLMADNYLNSLSLIRLASIAVFVGSIFVIGLTIFNEGDLVEKGYGLFPYGFNGGVVYKNYFGGNMLCVIIGILLYGQCYSFKHFDVIVLLCAGLGLLFSGSQGAMLLLGFFVGAVFILKRFQVQTPVVRQLKILFIPIFLLCFVLAFSIIALNSETYLYRFRGFLNYLTTFGSDLEIMLLGNASMAYADGASYVINVRQATGFDGSLEFAYLDILIKNGIIGLVGFIVIFLRYFFSFKQSSSKLKPFAIALLLTLLLSGMVETYIQSVHAVFGVYCYLVLSGLCGNMNEGFDKRQQKRN